MWEYALLWNAGTPHINPRNQPYWLSSVVIWDGYFTQYNRTPQLKQNGWLDLQLSRFLVVNREERYFLYWYIFFWKFLKCVYLRHFENILHKKKDFFSFFSSDFKCFCVMIKCFQYFLDYRIWGFLEVISFTRCFCSADGGFKIFNVWALEIIFDGSEW